MCSLNHALKIEAVIELFHPQSVLDVGCGTGRSMDDFISRGIHAEGIEGSDLAISQARFPQHIHQRNLNDEIQLGKRFDLVWCLEVAEHIHPRYVRNFVATCCHHADRVVMSAAPPGQGGEGHFNEQPLSYWVEKFAEFGFDWDQRNSAHLQSIDERFSDNVLTLVRRDPSPSSMRPPPRRPDRSPVRPSSRCFAPTARWS